MFIRRRSPRAPRVPGAKGGREQPGAEFATTVRGLLSLRDWLASFGVTQVVMEASGVHWKPPWAILEHEFDCMPVNARHVKQAPGHKTDVSDAKWLYRLLEAVLRASFAPPKPIRELHNLTRYRNTQIQQRAREVNRQHKALEDAGIKLDCVTADILGKSGRDTLDALVAGTTHPAVLANLARAQTRKKIPALTQALEGRFDSHHALWIGSILTHIDSLYDQIERLSDANEEQIRPFGAAVELLRTSTGIQHRAAEMIINEIGAHMSKFPTARHPASWARHCPGNNQSAGKRHSATRATPPSGWTAPPKKSRSPRSAPNTTTTTPQYKRLKPRRGHKKALGAVKHTAIHTV